MATFICIGLRSVCGCDVWLLRQRCPLRHDQLWRAHACVTAGLCAAAVHENGPKRWAAICGRCVESTKSGSWLKQCTTGKVQRGIVCGGGARPAACAATRLNRERRSRSARALRVGFDVTNFVARQHKACSAMPDHVAVIALLPVALRQARHDAIVPRSSCSSPLRRRSASVTAKGPSSPSSSTMRSAPPNAWLFVDAVYVTRHRMPAPTAASTPICESSMTRHSSGATPRRSAPHIPVDQRSGACTPATPHPQCHSTMVPN